jgi:phospholipid/cholesterol/gamma-HCH transport system ATP-binding protein
MSATAIRVRGLEKSFGGRRVLAGVDLDLEKGRSLVIIGASGTGKSVLLKCILGLIRADKGSIAIDGEDVSRAPAAARRRATQKIGMLFQGAALFDSLSVADNIAFRLTHGEGQGESRPRGAAREIALARLADVGLPPEVGAMRPSELSGGMQKRVALARALAAAPEILFFDEPTTGLDPITADVINRLIAERVRALGATAISITHDLSSARKIADEVAMLHGGRIIWRGAPSALEASGDPYVDQFVHGRADGPIKMSLRAV